MADFNDPNEDPNDLSKKIRPDGVTALSGVIDGVSAMYGEDGAGAIYLSVDDATITFDAQGGTFKDDSLKRQRKLWSAKRKATAALLRNAQHAKLLFRI